MAKSFKKSIAVLLSALMIATTLPFTAITASAADKVVYEFDAFAQATGGWSYEGGSENGHSYNVFTTDGGDAGYSRTGSGLATFNRGCLFLNDDTVSNYVHNGVFTVEFTGKVDSTDQTYTLMGIAINKESGELFRLESNGDIVINNAVVKNIAIDSTVMNDYAVSYDRNTFKIYVNGVEKASIDAVIDYASIGYVSIGWTDRCGHAKSIATYDMVSVSNTTFDVASYLADKKASAQNAGDVKTGTAWGNVDWNGMSNYANLLYCSNSKETSGETSCGYLRLKLNVPSRVVMMYDGKTAPKFQVYVEQYVSNSSGGAFSYAFPVESGSDTSLSPNYMFDTLWYGQDSSLDFNATAKNAGYNVATANNTNWTNKNTHAYFYNTLNYTGNETFDNGSSVHKGLFFYGYNNTRGTYFNTNVDWCYQYVVNYKPIADIYADVKAKVADVASQPAGYYVNEAEFYSKAADVLNLDPNAGCYDYANHTDYAVQNVASSIKNAVDAYNDFVLVKHDCVEGELVDYKDSTCAEEGYNGDRYCTVCNEKLVTGTVIEKKDHTAGELVDYKDSTCAEEGYTGDKYCIVCNEKLVTGTVIEKKAHTAGEAVQENVDAPTASKAGSHDEVVYCTVCKTEISRTPVVDDATGNYEAYNNELEVVESLKAEEYTELSWKAFQEELKSAKTLAENATTQNDIDNATNMIMTAVNNLEKAYFNVTVAIDGEDGYVFNDSVKNGAVFTYTVDTQGKSVYKWTAETTKGTQKLPTGVATMSAVITEKTDFIVYLAEESGSANIKVTYQGYGGKTVAVNYVDDIANASKSASIAESIPFYSFVEWTEYKNSDTDYTMVPTYAPTAEMENYCHVTLEGIDNLNSSQGNDFRTYYDAPVEYDKESLGDAVLRFQTAEGQVYYMANTGNFNVPYTKTLKVSVAGEVEPSIFIVSSFKTIDETNTPVASFNTVYYLPKGAEFVEAGVVATTNVNAGDFVMGQSRVLKFASTYAATSCQFTSSIASTFGGAAQVFARPYITYTIDGATQTVYGNKTAVKLK